MNTSKWLRIIVILVFYFLFGISSRISPFATYFINLSIANTISSTSSNFQGWFPGELGLAISPDGQKAYVSFEQDDSLLVVDLDTFTVTDSIDVSPAGKMLNSAAAKLTPDGKKLYVSNIGTQNLMVINTETNRVEKVLPAKPLPPVGPIAMSLDGSKAYLPGGQGGLYVVNTADNSFSSVYAPGLSFSVVAPSAKHANLLYAVQSTTTPEGKFQSSFFVFNILTGTVERLLDLPNDVVPSGTSIHRLIVDSSETYAYFGSFMFGTEKKGVGNFSVFDINNFKIAASEPMEYGVTDFAVNEKTNKIYISGWLYPDLGPLNAEMPVQEWDISTNKITRTILMKPSSDPGGLAINPNDENYFYMTEGDANLLRKVDISNGKEVNRVQFNKSVIKPNTIVRGDKIGYIGSLSNKGNIYRIDLESGQFLGNIAPLPYSIGSVGGYFQGKLYISDATNIYAVNPDDGSIIQSYPIGMRTQLTAFTFLNGKMVSLDRQIPGRLFVFDAGSIAILKIIDLPPESHGDKVIGSPDGSKFYVIRGGMSVGGEAIISIFDASSLNIIGTLQIPPAPRLEWPKGGATETPEGDFDEINRVLYLTGHASVYKIHMDTNELIGIIDLKDAYKSQGIGGWSPSGLSGVVLSPSKDKLHVVSLDAHSMFTYDLINSFWLTKITNVKGYFPPDATASKDKHYLFTVNQGSDSLTMIDLTSGDVVNVIEFPSETVSIPYIPSGPTNGVVSESCNYTAGGSSSTQGHSLEYQFDWRGDGHDLSSWGSGSQSKTWTVAGTYNVRARARCTQDTSIVSGWSSGLLVTINAEIVVTPNTPSGPTSGIIGKSYIYTTGGSTSSLGSAVEYQFDWRGDGSDLSDWGPATQSKIWSASGVYNVRARARSTTNLSIMSGWPSPLSVAISVPKISVTPATYDFGKLKVKRSKTGVFKVTNRGTADLSISTSIAGTDASLFAITVGGGSKIIKAGRSLNIRVAFKPTSTGSKGANLEITSNDPNSPTIDVPLSGTGQ